MGNEERAEQTAPSFKPVIKAEGGGRGWEGGGEGGAVWERRRVEEGWFKIAT